MGSSVDWTGWLEWDTWLFRGARSLWRRARPEVADPVAAAAAALTAHQASLTVLAQAVAGRPVLLRPAEARGGVRRSVILLPTALAASADPLDNVRRLRLRTVFSAGVIACGAPLPGVSAPGVALAHWVAACRQARSWLGQALPGFADEWARVAGQELAEREAAAVARGGLEAGSPEARIEAAWAVALTGPVDDLEAFRTTGAALVGLTARRWPEAPWLLGGPLSAAEQAAADAAWRAAKTPEPAVRAGASELDAPARDHVTRLAFDPDAEPDGRPTHSFEKVETLEAWSGGHPPVDAEDDLADHAEALAEVDLRHVVRGGEAAGAVYRAEVDLSGGIPDVSDVGPLPGIPYPEWDGKARALRPGWVTVRPEILSERAPDFGVQAARQHGPLIRTLHRRLEAQRLARVHQSRQRDGTGLDLDAIVADRADRLAGRPPSDRLYVDQRPLRHDRVTLVVLDLSLSSDAWVEDRRVLDLTREAVVVLGEVLDRLGEPLGVAGFASHTRHHCGFWTVKGFDEPWRPARDRLGALTPRGYTRMGPAVRHGAALLAGRPERHKLLVLISDGKPTDFDRYEGRHGREDVGHAVRAARQDRVLVHGLGLDPSARAALPTMFGVGGWSLVRHPARLPEALAGAYAQLTRGA
ncbi:MAG: hypothetical protein H6702_12410 [Myxococcales bacterium]|nr:hypothetical protein [Myxococcales bacterium]